MYCMRRILETRHALSGVHVCLDDDRSWRRGEVTTIAVSHSGEYGIQLFSRRRRCSHAIVNWLGADETLARAR